MSSPKVATLYLNASFNFYTYVKMHWFLLLRIKFVI